MGGSLYNSKKLSKVVHTDFLPFATTKQMSRISSKEELLDSKFAKELLQDTLELLEPSLIIVLGKEHCGRFSKLEKGIYFESPKSISQFPDAYYQIGFHSLLNIPVIGLHFKPSEQFIGLGGGSDRNGISHGKYATKEALDIMGKEVLTQLKKLFPLSFDLKRIN
jgi:hypothetical protein